MPVNVISTIEPAGSADFPIVADAHLGGGWRTVADTAARDAITSERRAAGMHVYVIDSGLVWVLGAGLGNGDWTSLVNVDNIQFDVATAAVTPVEGLLQWDAEEKTLALGMPGGTVNLQLGQEFVKRCKNTSGGDIPNGTNVYATGATGSAPNIAPADNGSLAASFLFGMTTEAIADGDFGFVTTAGVVNGVNTVGLTAGQLLWLGSAGAYTVTRPAAPAFSVVVGGVLRVSETEGAIYMRPVYVARLTHLSDCNVRETALTDGDVMSWDLGNLRFDRLGNIRAGATKAIHWDGLSKMSSPADGQILFTNDAGDDFDRAFLGGTTANHPAIARQAGSSTINFLRGTGTTKAAISALLGTFSSYVRVDATARFYWNTRSRLYSDADGNIRLTNNAAADFGLLQLGGVTAAFPAWTRDGANVRARLANDSGDTGVIADEFTAGGGVGEFGSTPPASQPIAIADVPTGGSADAAANATAINSILAVLRARGTIAT